MSLAMLVAWAMLAALIGWIAIVLYATVRTLDGEVRQAASERRRGASRPDGRRGRTPDRRRRQRG